MARGCRVLGHRRLRNFLITALAFAGLLGAALPALGASGGTSVGAAGRRHVHRAGRAHRSRPPRRRHVRRRKVSGHSSRASKPLTGRAMWIWELPYTNGGNLASIVASAHRYGVATLLIKSSDGTGLWSQFTPQLVSTLHANGLRVCAWQYVYGNHPVTEAYMGAAAVRDGADCLIIDAESEYEGKYVSAQTYIQRLRKLIGYGYPLVLAGFPYIDYHPAFPYSVFLGPGGAQANAPQMYWKDIGVTVDDVFSHTYAFNRIYGRPIYPLGQVYSRPPAHQIVRFRQLSRSYGAPGVSWWDWQEATRSAWTAISRPAGTPTGYVPNSLMATIQKGAVGDLVVWAQEHLISAGLNLGIDGGFGTGTQTAVEAFQTAHGLTGDGVIGPATWQALLHYRTVRVVWGHRGRSRTVTVARATATSAAGAGAVRYAPVPKSASRPARRDEIAGAGGAGHSRRP